MQKIKGSRDSKLEVNQVKLPDVEKYLDKHMVFYKMFNGDLSNLSLNVKCLVFVITQICFIPYGLALNHCETGSSFNTDSL